MALDLLTTTAFHRDLKRVRKQGHDLDNWIGHWDCHIEPDWLLLYKVTDTELTLVRTGSHAELFA